MLTINPLSRVTYRLKEFCDRYLNNGTYFRIGYGYKETRHANNPWVFRIASGGTKGHLYHLHLDLSPQVDFDLKVKKPIIGLTCKMGSDYSGSLKVNVRWLWVVIWGQK